MGIWFWWLFVLDWAFMEIVVPPVPQNISDNNSLNLPTSIQLILESLILQPVEGISIQK